MRFRAHLSVAVILGTLGVLLDGGALHAGFSADDDPGLLAYAMTHPLAQYAFDPITWQGLSWANFTPGLVLDFALDFRLFGIDPVGFHAHHLLLLWGCVGLLYVLLQRFMKAPWALLGAVLFLLATPVTALAYQLMARHYVTGLFFCLMAILCFLRAQDPAPTSRRGIWLAMSAAAYAGALLNKEIFALLPLPLLFLPQGNWRQRGMMLLPFVALALGYLAWRSRMLGSPVGAYSTPGSWALPGTLSLQLTSVVGLAVLVGRGERLRRLMFGAAVLGATLLPLIPVHAAVADTPRYGLLPALVFSAAGAALLSSLASQGRWTRAGVWVLVGLLLLRAGVATEREATAQALQAREALQRDQPFWKEDGAVLVWLPAAVPSWHVEGIETIRHLRDPAATSPQFIYDAMQLRHLHHGFRTLLRLDPATGAYAPVAQAELLGRVTSWCERRRSAPLTVDMAYDSTSKVMHWHLGPQAEGIYQLVVVDGGVLPVPQEHTVRLLVSRPQLYVRYDSPQGALTYSDLLTLPEHGSLHWSGAADAPRSEPVAACIAATMPVDAL